MNKEDSKPWIEKYRPKTIDDVVQQNEVTNALKTALNSQNLPHLLFYGPAGTGIFKKKFIFLGKTSTILAICQQLYGPEFFSSRVLELNASDERGIDAIRNKVKKFAQISVGNKPEGYNYPLPPFKIIILDEADSMTKDAQAALRRTMEMYSKVTRFCLICNYISRIIEPLTSRCAKFRFKSLENEVLNDKLLDICKKEKIDDISKETIEEIIKLSYGDLRKGITYLQSCKMIFDKISIENIQEIAGFIPNPIINGFFKSTSSNSFDKLKDYVDLIIKNGYSAKQFIIQFNDFIISSNDLLDDQKARISFQISEMEKNLLDGSDEYLQILNLGAFMMRNN